jgi:hypothetical protein
MGARLAEAEAAVFRGQGPLSPPRQGASLASCSPPRGSLRWKGQDLEGRGPSGGREVLEGPADPGPVQGPSFLDPQRDVAEGTGHAARSLQDAPPEGLPAPEWGLRVLGPGDDRYASGWPPSC